MLEGLPGRERGQRRRVGERCADNLQRGETGIGHNGAVEHAIEIEILQVAGVIEPVVQVAGLERRSADAGVGPADEIVADHVGEGIAGRVAGGDVAAAAAPVVDDVVLIIIHALNLGIAHPIIDVETAENAHAPIGLHETTGRVRQQPLADEAILQGNIGDGRSADGESLVAAPGGGDVVENHVVARRDADRVRATVAVDALANPEVAANGVVCAGEGHAVAINGDAAAGCRLTGDRDIVFHRDHGVDANNTADIEDHRTVGHAHGVTERAGAGVVEIGDVINRAAAPARGVGSEAFCAGERGGGRDADEAEREQRGQKNRGRTE